MIAAAVAWLATSRLGQWLAIAAAAVAALGAALLAARRGGRQAAEAVAQAAQIKARDTRDGIDRDVGRAGADDVARRLREWQRD